MGISSISTAVFLFCFNIAICQQQILGAQPLLRNASLEDVDDIASVIIAAFSPLPSWQYMYQFNERYPKEHHRFVGFGVLQALTAASYRVEVIEAPAKSTLAVAAVAMWQQNTLQDGSFSHKLFKECQHRDMNLTRAIDMDHKFSAAKRKYIDQTFGPTQLYLDLLCTHPDFQMHGAGTRLVHRGIEVGKENNINVTLIAQPTAHGFYVHNGFDSIVNISISSVDEDEFFAYNVMAYHLISRE